MTENEVKEDIKNWLDFNGWYHFPIWQGRYSVKGISDRIAIKKGEILFIEIKSTTGKLRIDQKIFQERISEKGGHYVVARKWEDLSEYIRKNLEV